MICDTCEKMRKRNKHGVKYHDCAVLIGNLPVWGPECAAYTDDPNWAAAVEEASMLYQLGRKETS